MLDFLRRTTTVQEATIRNNLINAGFAYLDHERRISVLSGGERARLMFLTLRLNRPAARNGPYYGLMQILPATARQMGFRGQPSDLLDAQTNLTYAVRYLRGAWMVSDGNEPEAVMWYARGYYYEARNRCMLVATGLRDTEVRKYCG